MFEVRRATLEDIDWLVDVGIKDMFSILGNEQFLNVEYMKNHFIPYLIKNGIVLVVEDYAAIIGEIAPHPYNPDILVAAEFMWWVRDDKRNTSVGYRLLKVFEEVAKHAKVDYIALSLMPKSTVNSLQKQGYLEKESSYIKEL